MKKLDILNDLGDTIDSLDTLAEKLILAGVDKSSLVLTKINEASDILELISLEVRKRNSKVL